MEFFTNKSNGNHYKVDLIYVPNPTAGGSSSKKRQPKKTDEKINIKGRTRSVYIGTRGGKYVKVKGEFVSVQSLSKAKK